MANQPSLNVLHDPAIGSYYREKRDLNSLPYADLFENVTLVEDALVQGDVALIPWLVEDEWKN